LRIDKQDYFVPFEPENLKALAERTGGTYAHAPTLENLSLVYQQLGAGVRWEFTLHEISWLLSLLALLLLLVGGGLGLRWQRRVP
jgi:Ca-activated chloride channel family protein